MTDDQRKEAFRTFRLTLPKDHSERLQRFFLDLNELERKHGTNVMRDGILYLSMAIEFAAEEIEGDDLGWEVQYSGNS